MYERAASTGINDGNLISYATAKELLLRTSYTQIEYPGHVKDNFATIKKLLRQLQLKIVTISNLFASGSISNPTVR